jgi:hypothetical protein
MVILYIYSTCWCIKSTFYECQLAPPAKVMSCTLVASTDLERALDATKEVTEGAGVPLVKMSSQLAGQLPWIAGHGLWPFGPL